jgi:hypothetical protein
MLTFRILYMINVEYFYQVCFVKYAKKGTQEFVQLGETVKIGCSEN